MWRPKSLLEAIENGEQVSIETDKNGRYKCPNCGSRRPAAAIVDVRELPIVEGWACDSCWSGWLREGRDIDGNGPVADRIKWREQWAKAHKAPDEVVEKIRSSRRQ